jgi:hypothetical protein
VFDLSSYGRTLGNLADETALEALLDTLPNVTSIGGDVVAGGDFTSTDDIISGDDVLISASGVINFEAGDCTLTDGTNMLTMDGCDLTSEAHIPDGDNTRALGSGAATWSQIDVTTIELANGTTHTIAGSGGDLTVEGNRIFRVGGADVPVADGGTGQSTEAEALGEMTQALTEDTAPDQAADFVMTYDASADTGKKVRLDNTAGLVKLAAGTVSAAATLDLALDTYGSDYIAFRLILQDINPDTASQQLIMRFSDDGGSTFEADASDYIYLVQSVDITGTTEVETLQGNSAGAQIIITGAEAVGETDNTGGISCDITIYEPQTAAKTTRAMWQCGGWNDDGPDKWVTMTGSGNMVAATASTDVRLLFVTGNIEAARYVLYGMRQ